MIENAETFKKEREEKFGGEIRFMTYTKFIGTASSSKVINRGGILYVIKDTIHFEDFEKSGGLMIILNQKEDYTKTEFSLELEKISMVKEIREKDAINCVNRRISENEILPGPKGVLSLFSKSVLQVFATGQNSLFFDLLDKEDFMKIINEYMLKSH
ncbi:MAG: hypothetical protein PF518_00280 [Spirochaetaceae bacterium]|jgi:hypothetical protein|nr:hypothetical protein [Spirochaetaceae bacterium]